MSVNLQIVKNLKLKGYTVLPGQTFCQQCVIEYQSIVNKDEKESDNENESSESNKELMIDEDEDYCEDESPRKKLNSSLASVGISPVDIHDVAKQRERNATAKLRKVLDVYVDSIATAMFRIYT